MAKAVIFLLTANCASLFWAALSFRGLFADGVFFTFRLLLERKPFWDEKFFRFFSVVLQVPSLLWLRLFPEEPTGRIPALLFQLCLHMHPALSLYLSHRILKTFKRPELFLFPALSFAICTQSLMGFPALIIPETLSLYWPCALILLFRQGRTRWEMPVLAAGTLCLFFTYESALLFFVANIAFLLFCRPAAETKTGDHALLGLNAAGLGFMFWRLLGPHAAPQKGFWEAIETSDFQESFRLFGLAVLGVFAGSLGAWWCRPRFDKEISRWALGLGILPVCWLAREFLNLPAFQFLVSQWSMRVTVIPFSFLIACLAAFAGCSRSARRLRRSRTFFSLSLVLCAVLCAALAHDIKISREWRRGWERLHSLRSQNPGCNVIDEMSARKLIGETLEGFWLPFYSMDLEGFPKVDSLFFLETPVTGAHCRVETSSKLPRDNTFMIDEIPVPLRSYEFQRQIFEQPIRLHRWDPISQRVLLEIASKPKPNS